MDLASRHNNSSTEPDEWSWGDRTNLFLQLINQIPKPRHVWINICLWSLSSLFPIPTTRCLPGAEGGGDCSTTCSTSRDESEMRPWSTNMYECFLFVCLFVCFFALRRETSLLQHCTTHDEEQACYSLKTGAPLMWYCLKIVKAERILKYNRVDLLSCTL